MPSIAWNRQEWGRDHTWAALGDEWDDLAQYCGQPYDEWKATLVETFIRPNRTRADVLEIAPGYGRWTEYLVDSARSVVLVDINENCLAACRQRFGHLQHVEYHVGNGSALPGPNASRDFVFSFDALVHMDPPVVEAYVNEIGRILRPGGCAVIHHADKRQWSIALVSVTSRIGLIGRGVQQVASQGRLRDDGNRSHVTGQMVADWARSAGLTVEQTRSWGSKEQYNVAKYRDLISILRKPLGLAGRS